MQNMELPQLPCVMPAFLSAVLPAVSASDGWGQLPQNMELPQLPRITAVTMVPTSHPVISHCRCRQLSAMDGGNYCRHQGLPQLQWVPPVVLSSVIVIVVSHQQWMGAITADTKDYRSYHGSHQSSCCQSLLLSSVVSDGCGQLLQTPRITTVTMGPTSCISHISISCIRIWNCHRQQGSHSRLGVI